MPKWTYKALLIGNAHFPEDPHGLETLYGPWNDIERLGQTLTDSEVGLHDPANVTVLYDRPSGELRDAIASFFGEARQGEQLLLYYSGHGRRADSGELCLCAHNTKPGADHTLRSTAIDAYYIAELMRSSVATAKVIVLDCCYSGAFGHRFRGGELPHYLRGEGQFGLYSARVFEQSPDAPDRDAMSPFTECLVQALSLGTLDRDGDGFVDLEDAYSYILRVLRPTRSATPTRSMPGPTIGTVALARSRRPPDAATGAPVDASAGVADPGTAHPHTVDSDTVHPNRARPGGARFWRLPASLILPVGPPTLAPVPPDRPMFRMASNLVTNRQFAQFLAEEANAGWRAGGDLAADQADRDYLRHWPAEGLPGGLSEHPVVNVSALAAQAYVDWVARRWGIPLRLPYRREWEAAARAGRSAADYVESALADMAVNFRNTDGALTAVDEMPLNPYDIGDLLGNAFDTCLPDGADKPAGGVVACGGSYWTPRQLLTSCIRLRPDECRDDVGFRCVQPLSNRDL